MCYYPLMETYLLKVEPATSCCTPAAQPTITGNQAKSAAELFKAFADETRLGILSLLAQSDGEVCVCDITDSFQLGQPTISHHLKILRDAGLISADKRGKWVYYSLVRDRVQHVQHLVEELTGAPLLVG
jgi:ArsR family transcriptional regulator, arsenate/arsenite/antimonite-responsive transcriptional repressor